MFSLSDHSLDFDWLWVYSLMCDVETHFVAFNFVTTKTSAKIRMIISILRVPCARMLQQNMHKTITQVSSAQMARTARAHSIWLLTDLFEHFLFHMLYELRFQQIALVRRKWKYEWLHRSRVFLGRVLFEHTTRIISGCAKSCVLFAYYAPKVLILHKRVFKPRCVSRLPEEKNYTSRTFAIRMRDNPFSELHSEHREK